MLTMTRVLRVLELQRERGNEWTLVLPPVCGDLVHGGTGDRFDRLEMSKLLDREHLKSTLKLNVIDMEEFEVKANSTPLKAFWLEIIRISEYD